MTGGESLGTGLGFGGPGRGADLAEAEEDGAEEEVGHKREDEAFGQPVHRARHPEGPAKDQRAAGPVPGAVRRAHAHQRDDAEERVAAVVQRLAYKSRRQCREGRLPARWEIREFCSDSECSARFWPGCFMRKYR